jgi:hypothetical protein
MSSLTPEQFNTARRRLRVIKWVGLFDAALLIALIISSLTGNRDFVRVFGPLHGGNFLLLLTLVGVGASDGLWSWWFPAGAAHVHPNRRWPRSQACGMDRASSHRHRHRPDDARSICQQLIAPSRPLSLPCML